MVGRQTNFTKERTTIVYNNDFTCADVNKCLAVIKVSIQHKPFVGDKEGNILRNQEILESNNLYIFLSIWQHFIGMYQALYLFKNLIEKIMFFKKDMKFLKE